jgi:hypothetical protein
MTMWPEWLDLSSTDDKKAESAQAELMVRVSEELAAAADEERQFALLPWHTHPDFRIDGSLASTALPPTVSDAQRSAIVERKAVSAAQRGEPERLGDLVRLGRPLVTSDARRLAIELITGERNPRTGRRKGERGRPKMSRNERRAKNPAHDAAGEFPMIREILRRHYSKQPSKQISDRAEELAKLRAKTTTSVHNLRMRARKTGHKI